MPYHCLIYKKEKILIEKKDPVLLSKPQQIKKNKTLKAVDLGSHYKQITFSI